MPPHSPGRATSPTAARAPAPLGELALPRTEKANSDLLKLPSFPNGDRCILDQYIEAFEKVMAHSDEIIAACKSSDQEAASPSPPT